MGAAIGIKRIFQSTLGGVVYVGAFYCIGDKESVKKFFAFVKGKVTKAK